jgi:hypothetical protein
MEWLGLLKDGAVGLVTGVAASVTYEKLTAVRRESELRKTFGGLQGQYDELVKKLGAEISTTGGTISLTYCGGRKFTTLATTASGEKLWEGEINIGQDTDVLGAGYYRHLNSDNNGIHRIIYMPKLGQFDVSGENTSHPDGVKDFKMIWKRKI